MTETVLLVGTKKGLWIGRSDAARRRWQWSKPKFLMRGIYGLGIDTACRRPGCSSAARANTGGGASTAPTTWAAPGARTPASRYGSPPT